MCYFKTNTMKTIILLSLIICSCNKTYVCVHEQTVTGHPLISHNGKKLINTFVIQGQEEDRKKTESTIKIKGEHGQNILLQIKCE